MARQMLCWSRKCATHLARHLLPECKLCAACFSVCAFPAFSMRHRKCYRALNVPTMPQQVACQATFRLWIGTLFAVAFWH